MYSRGPPGPCLATLKPMPYTACIHHAHAANSSQNVAVIASLWKYSFVGQGVVYFHEYAMVLMDSFPRLSVTMPFISVLSEPL